MPVRSGLAGNRAVSVGCGLALCGLTLGAHFCGDCLHLLERMSGLLTEHAQPFTAVLEETDPQADAEDIHRAAEQVQAIAAEMSTQSQTTQRQAAAHTNGTVAR